MRLAAMCLEWKAHSEVASSTNAGLCLACSPRALRCAVPCSTRLSLSATNTWLPPIRSHTSLTMSPLNSALHVPCLTAQPQGPDKVCCPPAEGEAVILQGVPHRC